MYNIYKFGREGTYSPRHLWNPTFANQAAAWYGARTGTWPSQYLSGRDQAFRELAKARADRLALQRTARPARHREV